MISNLEEILQLFDKQYHYQKSLGNQEVFFNEAFDPADYCFEARARSLRNFNSLHPISHNDNIDPVSIPDYTSRDLYNKIIGEELKIFRMKQIREKVLLSTQAPSMCDFRVYLLEEKNIRDGRHRRAGYYQEIH